MGADVLAVYAEMTLHAVGVSVAVMALVVIVREIRGWYYAR